jgi:hypothetical protein
VRIEALLRRRGAWWPRWVEPAYVEALLRAAEIADQDGAVLWRCAWLEHWCEHGGQIDPALRTARD